MDLNAMNTNNNRFVPKTPFLTVDALIIYEGKLVLIRRLNPPFENQFALPGGFVEIGETVEAAAVREAKEETGLDIELIRLLGVYSDPSRDPRGHTVTVCYLARGFGKLKAGSDAKDIRLFGINEIPKLAFDHNKIIENAKSDIDGILSQV
jgi:8-oxo-dGTP diphosphatase